MNQIDQLDQLATFVATRKNVLVDALNQTRSDMVMLRTEARIDELSNILKEIDRLTGCPEALVSEPNTATTTYCPIAPEDVKEGDWAVCNATRHRLESYGLNNELLRVVTASGTNYIGRLVELGFTFERDVAAESKAPNTLTVAVQLAYGEHAGVGIFPKEAVGHRYRCEVID